jgi:hypothetical protein
VLISLKNMLYGDGDSEPVPELVAQLSQETYNADLLSLLITNMGLFEFEVGCCAVLCCAVPHGPRRQPIDNLSTRAHYPHRNHRPRRTCPKSSTTF